METQMLHYAWCITTANIKRRFRQRKTLYVTYFYFILIKCIHLQYYMSPPAGDIYCSSLRVCPSVRPYVRPSVCPYVTLPLSQPYLLEPLIEKNWKNSINNIPTEVVQRKIKIQFCQKFKKFWPKNHFLNLCFVQARSR